jgi:hypothetical protein
MRKEICLVVIFTALILTAGVGGWTVLTTSHVNAAAKATNSDEFRGATTLGGGLFFMPAPVY